MDCGTDRRLMLIACGAAVSLAACAVSARPGPDVLVPTTASVVATAPEPIRRASLTERERAFHALNRLTFGPRPGDVERVLSVGVDRWIEQQLNAEAIPDSAALLGLAPFPRWTDPVDSAITRVSPWVDFTRYNENGRPMSGTVVLGGGLMQLMPRADARASGATATANLENIHLITGRITRAERSERQLLEVMTDFWENHFSVFGGRLTRAEIVSYERATIHPEALGRFRDLLGAVAQSPAMLKYLDNVSNRAGRPNENFARELLELHTLGVDGGYTESDVRDVARAFTGWTVGGTGSAEMFGPRSAIPYFDFDFGKHDLGPKVVLGHAMPADRWQSDGEEVLDLLAKHPATARHISRKLAVRFVRDDPPEALIQRAAATFLRTDGDIREVLRTIFTSEEFFSPAAYAVKIKSPHEFLLSIRRALAVPVDTAGEMIDLLIRMEQPPFGRTAPNGWPETGASWMSAGGMATRVNIANAVAHGEHESIPVERSPLWSELAAQPFDVQLSGVRGGLLQDRAGSSTLAAFASARPDTDSPAARERALRDLIALALASPEFQRR